MFEDQQVMQPAVDPTMDPNAQMGMPPQEDTFEPLIKSKADIPLSADQAKKMETVAKIRQIEAKTKEIEAKAKQLENGGMDPNMGGGAIDPMTGMPMGGGQIDPNTGMPIGGGQIDPMTGMPMGGGQIDPNTGMPMDPSQNDPLLGLGDKSAVGGGGMMGGMDPMSGMPAGPTTVFTAIGRAYKLKQVFHDLLRIKTYLRDSTDSELQSLYKDVNTAFDLFKVVVDNLKIYKDQVDNLIIMYFELIKMLVEQITGTLNEKYPEE